MERHTLAKRAPQHSGLAGTVRGQSDARRLTDCITLSGRGGRRECARSRLLACRLAGAIGRFAPDRDDLRTCVLGEIRAVGPSLRTSRASSATRWMPYAARSAIGWGVTAVARTTAARWPRSG